MNLARLHEQPTLRNDMRLVVKLCPGSGNLGVTTELHNQSMSLETKANKRSIWLLHCRQS